jgi:DNA-binding beta-propeller fold protein YncE
VRGKSRSLGFIPSGWYPTSVRVTPDGKTLLVVNGKGIVSFASDFPGKIVPIHLVAGQEVIAQKQAFSFKGKIGRNKEDSHKTRHIYFL